MEPHRELQFTLTLIAVKFNIANINIASISYQFLLACLTDKRLQLQQSACQIWLINQEGHQLDVLHICDSNMLQMLWGQSLSAAYPVLCMHCSMHMGTLDAILAA